MNSLYYNKNVVLIDTPEIIGIVRRSLSKIDVRLIDHGERVGYIAFKICEQSKDRDFFDKSILLTLCALHDVGAYKTDEIENMVRFETEASYDHSLFGYLFLKNVKQLSEFSEAILYHHTNYTSPALKACKCKKYAELIHLADRIDILMAANKKNFAAIKKLSAIQFNPEYVEAFFKAEKEFELSKRIESGEYKPELEELIHSFVKIKNDEIIDYLKLLVFAIDFRSPFTVTHTADTTIISVEAAKLLGVSDNDMEAIYLGAFLHDIGKIAIPYKILEKSSSLTDNEFRIIKNHVDEGEAILRGVVSDKICNIALHHHERLDGSGYSKGLTAESLTLPERIVAVADILSALLRERPYKPPFPKEKVISILTDMKNKGWLCERVVDTVCNNYDFIIKNTEKSHDPVKSSYLNITKEFEALSAEHN